MVSTLAHAYERKRDAGSHARKELSSSAHLTRSGGPGARPRHAPQLAIGHREEDTLMNTVLVTGATGKIGSPLVPRLAARDGIAVRALVRNAENATPLTAAGAQLTLGTLEDARAVRAAVAGIDTLVLITAANPDA